jgi:hypothetical protein
MTAILLAADDGSRSPALIGLLVVFLMGVATFLLIRNMSGRLRRLPRSFPGQEPPGQEPSADETPKPPPS